MAQTFDFANLFASAFSQSRQNKVDESRFQQRLALDQQRVDLERSLRNAQVRQINQQLSQSKDLFPHVKAGAEADVAATRATTGLTNQQREQGAELFPMQKSLLGAQVGVEETKLDFLPRQLQDELDTSAALRGLYADQGASMRASAKRAGLEAEALQRAENARQEAMGARRERIYDDVFAAPQFTPEGKSATFGHALGAAARMAPGGQAIAPILGQLRFQNPFGGFDPEASAPNRQSVDQTIAASSARLQELRGLGNEAFFQVGAEEAQEASMALNQALMVLQQSGMSPGQKARRRQEISAVAQAWQRMLPEEDPLRQAFINLSNLAQENEEFGAAVQALKGARGDE